MVVTMIENHALRRTGIFFSAIFALSIPFNVFITLMLGKGAGFFEALANPTMMITYVFTALLIISTLWKRFSIIQPLLFIFITPLPLIQNPQGFFGLSIFVCGIILLYKGGYLERRRVIKTVVLLVYLYAWLTVGAIRLSLHRTFSFGPLFFMTAFLAFLYLVFKEQVVVYLKEKKPVLSLAEKGLSEAEAAYVRAAAKGLSPKEMAAEFGVTESTIRNTMSRAYKKLGVADRAGLAALLASHELEGEASEPAEAGLAPSPGPAPAPAGLGAAEPQA